MQSVKKVASIALSVVMWIIILVAALYAFTTLATREDGSVSDIAGFTPLAVQSDSMAPTFNKGDLIVIKKCDTSKLEVGDIVTFHTIIDNEYALNTHRIVAVEAAADGAPIYRTKGDANPVEDAAPVPAADVVGRVVFVSAGLGVVVSLLTNPLLFFPLIVVPLIVLLAGQTLFMILYVVLVVFNIMGRDYDAAVIVSGTCGFGMGATPNAMANMQAICDKYSPSVKAYLLIPLVGSLFADFLNSLVITVFINFI